MRYCRKPHYWKFGWQMWMLPIYVVLGITIKGLKAKIYWCHVVTYFTDHVIGMNSEVNQIKGWKWKMTISDKAKYFFFNGKHCLPNSDGTIIFRKKKDWATENWNCISLTFHRFLYLIYFIQSHWPLINKSQVKFSKDYLEMGYGLILLFRANHQIIIGVLQNEAVNLSFD